MSFLSPVHIVFFAAIALLALGPKRFPEFAKTLGNTVREFREVMSGATSAPPIEADSGEEDAPPAGGLGGEGV